MIPQDAFLLGGIFLTSGVILYFLIKAFYSMKQDDWILDTKNGQIPVAGEVMTDQYIITEEQIRDVAYDGHNNESLKRKLSALKEVRSHPYNPQAEQHLETISGNIFNAGYLKGKQAEREKVLDELEQWANEKWSFLFKVLPYNDAITKVTILEKIQLLRQEGKVEK